MKIDAGWEDAYTVDFTQGGGNGDRPIVVSYSSSPPFTVPKGGGKPTTSALLGTCFRQVEYAGVLTPETTTPCHPLLLASSSIGTIQPQTGRPREFQGF